MLAAGEDGVAGVSPGKAAEHWRSDDWGIGGLEDPRIGVRGMADD
jgi:hypothetical protein